MLSIFFHKSLTTFHETIASFPTVIFTVLLAFMFFYWMVAVVGIIEIDSLDFDLPEGIETNADMGIDASGEGGNLNVLAGVLVRFGLYGIPFAIILSIFAAIAWLISYYAALYLNKAFATGLMHYLIGFGVLMVTMLVSAWLTGKLIAPIRKRIAKIPKHNAKEILGKMALVRSSVVNDTYGEAILEDGGAGLVLKVRSDNTTFAKGDKVVLIKYRPEQNVYLVVSEAEFKHG